MPQTHPVGIDLGTTCCAVAHIDESGRSAIVRNAEGEILTPSVLLIDGDEIIVGEEAARRLAWNPITSPSVPSETWARRCIPSRSAARPIRPK